MSHLSDELLAPPPAHWRKSFVRSRSHDSKNKPKIDLLFDTINHIKVSKRRRRDSSEETIDIPRAFSPPGHVCHPYCHILPPPPPPPPPPIPSADPRIHNHSSSDSPLSSSSSTDSAPEDTGPISSSPGANSEFDPKTFRLNLDGHTYSADCMERRDRQRSHADNYDVSSAHYCARCGRPRSKRFQRENPIKPNVVVVPGICRRCEPRADEKPRLKRDSPLKKDEREVEEILIRRGRGHPDPIIRVFKTPPIEVVRVIRRSRSSSPRPSKARRLGAEKSSSSDNEDKEKNSTDPYPRQEAKFQQRKPNNVASYPSPVVRVRVRSESGTTWDVEPELEPARMSRRDDRNPDHLIASHPNAWSHVRRVSDSKPKTKPISTPKYKEHTRREPSPPEWFYRRQRTYVEPRGTQDEYWDRRGRIDEATYKRGVAAALRFAPKTESSSSSEGEPPLKGILNRPELEFPSERPGLGRGHYRRIGPTCKGPLDEVEPRPRVKFATPWTNSRVASRQKEAVEDWIEEKDDQRDFEKVKRRVRHDVHEGAGAFELDGHRSEGFEANGSHEDTELNQLYDAASRLSLASKNASRSGMELKLHSLAHNSGLTLPVSESFIVGDTDEYEGQGIDTEFSSVRDLDSQLGSEFSPFSSEFSTASGPARRARLVSRSYVQTQPRSSSHREIGAIAWESDGHGSQHRAKSQISTRRSDLSGHRINRVEKNDRDLSQDREMTSLIDRFARSDLSDDRRSHGTAELDVCHVSVSDSRGGRSSGTWEAEATTSELDPTGWQRHWKSGSKGSRTSSSSATAISESLGETRNSVGQFGREEYGQTVGGW